MERYLSFQRHMYVFMCQHSYSADRNQNSWFFCEFHEYEIQISDYETKVFAPRKHTFPYIVLRRLNGKEFDVFFLLLLLLSFFLSLKVNQRDSLQEELISLYHSHIKISLGEDFSHELGHKARSFWAPMALLWGLDVRGCDTLDGVAVSPSRKSLIFVPAGF